MTKLLQRILNWFYGIKPKDVDFLNEELIRVDKEFVLLQATHQTLTDSAYELAKLLRAAQKDKADIAHDYAIEMRTSGENQLQIDIFQQALTNTFDKEQIGVFFAWCDTLREEHENAKPKTH